jgi:hypothetical protein
VRVHVAPPAPIITGGGDVATACPDFHDVPSQVATALSIHMDSGVAEVVLETVGEASPAARFAGPAAGGNASIVKFSSGEVTPVADEPELRLRQDAHHEGILLLRALGHFL